MQRKKIAFAGPWITKKEEDYVLDAVRHGWYQTFNKDIVAFEKTVCDYIGRKFAIATHCCTHAMHIGCEALGFGRGDEVICTDFSWAATAHVIQYTGATPVFVDIDPETWCIDPAAIRGAIAERTKGIMLVHCFGHPAQMDEIMDIARTHNLRVIEDAAPSMGAEFRGQLVGSFGDVACFSFHGAKIAVSGEGGIFLTDDREVYERANLLANMGRTDSIMVFWSDQLGYQYTMGNLAASIARAQVERIDELVARKREIFGWYEARIGDVPAIQLIREREGCKSNYCYPSMLLEEEVAVDRDKLLAQLKELNIHCRPAFPRMSWFPMYEERFPNPVATRVAKRGISLPSAADLTQEDVDFVCDSMLRMIGR